MFICPANHTTIYTRNKMVLGSQQFQHTFNREIMYEMISYFLILKLYWICINHPKDRHLYLQSHQRDCFNTSWSDSVFFWNIVIIIQKQCYKEIIPFRQLNHSLIGFNRTKVLVIWYEKRHWNDIFWGIRGRFWIKETYSLSTWKRNSLFYLIIII